MHTDLIDLTVRPRGILPLWIIASLLVLLCKVFGANISWIAVAALPSIGVVLLNLALVYAVLEACQKDLVFLWRKAFDDDDENDEDYTRYDP